MSKGYTAMIRTDKGERFLSHATLEEIDQLVEKLRPDHFIREVSFPDPEIAISLHQLQYVHLRGKNWKNTQTLQQNVTAFRAVSILLNSMNAKTKET